MCGRAPAIDACPIAHGACGSIEPAGLPEGERHQAQDGDVVRFSVARIDQALGGELVVAFGHRALGGDHEPLDALLCRVGLGEVDEAHAAGGDGPHAVAEVDSRPLLDLLLAVRITAEVDAGDGPDAPLGVGKAACVAVHDGVIGHATGERIVLGAILGVRAGALLGLVRPPAGLLALTACRRGTRSHGVARDAPTTRALGEALELVGGLVDRLQMTLVLELPAGGRDGRGASAWPSGGGRAARRACRTAPGAPAGAGAARCRGPLRGMTRQR